MILWDSDSVVPSNAESTSTIEFFSFYSEAIIEWHSAIKEWRQNKYISLASFSKNFLISTGFLSYSFKGTYNLRILSIARKRLSHLAYGTTISHRLYLHNCTLLLIFRFQQCTRKSDEIFITKDSTSTSNSNSVACRIALWRICAGHPIPIISRSKLRLRCVISVITLFPSSSKHLQNLHWHYHL